MIFIPTACSLSHILSTAVLLAAEKSTFLPVLTSCLMISTRVRVLPVPGGPWIKERSFCCSERVTAARWD